MKKPSRKIIVLIGVALIITSAAAFQKFHTSGNLITTTPIEADTENSNINAVANIGTDTLDSDEDGLPDWQEVILGTNLNKKDTDGDGTDDKTELDLSRDPIVPGPNDKKTVVSENISAGASTSSDMNTSEMIAQNLFANSVYLSNNGEMTEENVGNLVNNLVNTTQNSFTYKEYTADKLPVISVENKDNFRFYASTLGTLQLKLLNDLSNTQDMTALSKLYGDYAANLYTLETPRELVDTELKFINNFSKVSSVYIALANQTKDPLKLPLAVKAYQDAGNEQSTLLKIIGEFLDKNDIINSLDASTQNYWELSLEE